MWQQVGLVCSFELVAGNSNPDKVTFGQRAKGEERISHMKISGKRVPGKEEEMAKRLVK